MIPRIGDWGAILQGGQMDRTAKASTKKMTHYETLLACAQLNYTLERR